jgi:hypothetical protein
MSPGEMEEIKARAVKKVQSTITESNVTKRNQL